jgi:hypothetical protein
VPSVHPYAPPLPLGVVTRYARRGGSIGASPAFTTWREYGVGRP